MKKSFKTYLTENKVSFYTLYNTTFPSDKLKKMTGKKKDDEQKIETIKYQKLMTDFLQNVGAMND